MSQRLSPWRKRAMPRWSILPRPVGISAEQTELSPVSIAGLPLSNATVWVGPPFDRRPPGFSTGFALKMLPPSSVIAAPAV